MKKYGHNSFCLAILEELGPVGTVSRELLLEREQFYLDILFTQYFERKLNVLPTAGSPLGMKLSVETKLKISESKKGSRHPMFGKTHSAETKLKLSGIFHPMYGRKGKAHPSFGKKISPESLVKWEKPVYVYDAQTQTLLGVFDSVKKCYPHFKMSKRTLYKYMKSGLPYKGRFFSCVQLDFINNK